MKRTKYFTTSLATNIKVWRLKNNQVRYFSPTGYEWNCSVHSPENIGTSKTKREGDVQITRDQARKLEPKAFR